jgi:4-hydroxy-tetrahydrodipicolinate reductase
MKIAILGYGKMGKAIEEIAVQRGHEVVLKINSHNKEELTLKNLKAADVAIEFSTPEYVLENINIALKAETPIAVGTTGWYDKRNEVHKAVQEQKGTFLAASNFSVGVNIFFEVNRRLAELMGNQDSYTAEMEEIHHTEKLDSPSGTAITLADDLIQRLPAYSNWENKVSDKKGILGITSIREPNVPGTHEVTYDSEVDKISIKHEAKSRKGFALGAVLAAEFIQTKKGIFTMQDVLKK